MRVTAGLPPSKGEDSSLPQAEAESPAVNGNTTSRQAEKSSTPETAKIPAEPNGVANHAPINGSTPRVDVTKGIRYRLMWRTGTFLKQTRM